MLQIKDLEVKIKDKIVLENFNLDILDNKIHVIMGPNGVGKSTLSKVIMGNTNYKVTKGDILFNNKSILSLETDERARLGIFLAFQNPLEIEGVTNSEFLRSAINSINEEQVSLYDFIKEMEKDFNDLKLNKEMMHRSLNTNFSGGEKKKNEILQMKMLKPKLIILDELDSGLDVDSLKIVCDNINNYLKENKDTSILMITHYPRILEYIKPDYIHVLKDGKIVETGDITLAEKIDKLYIDKDTTIIYLNSNCSYEIYLSNNINIFEYYKNSYSNNIYNILENSNIVFNRFSFNCSLITNINLDYPYTSIEYKYYCIKIYDNTYIININHNSKNTNSKVINHGLNVTSSKLDFLINGIINKESSNVICNQDSKIILKKDNNSSIKPNLLVNNYDTISNHSCYIGHFKEEEMFYLKSRGLNKKESERLLAKAFLLSNMDINFLNRNMILEDLKLIGGE